ncbi:MAG: hypothetical protein JO138_17470 [Acidobacteriaceae bacterium]|nr:hypothetical protein [Acidobacteriaceae bacterium]
MRPVLFREPLLFDADEELFFVACFLEELFFLLAPFFGGTFAPDRRASLNPIAIACFGFFTVFPLRPDFNS